jgi:hypothetical protein
MPSAEAQRTLVKSPPELWSELSDPVALGRHLGELGEIRIARIEPERSVEWEADNASGTVQLKPSGWGTRVTLTVNREAPAPVAAPVPEADPEPEPEPEPEPGPALGPEPRPKLFARILRRLRKRQPTSAPPPPPVQETAQTQETMRTQEPPDLAAELAAELASVEAAMAEQDVALLTAVLDRLGAAHHRPFSRG